MRSWVGPLGVLVCGCTIGTMAPRGETARAYRGTVPVVFTNATPDAMCGLYMSFDDADAYGDNWLPAEGLPAGASIEFRVRHGTYKARWDTCRPDEKQRPYYAATLFRELAVPVAEPTQLFAYVASAMAPTKLAPPRWDLKLVRFQGQPIEQDPASYAKRTARPARTVVAAPSVPRYLCRFCVSGFPSGIEAQFTEPLVEVPHTDLSAFVERKALGGKKPALRPSLRRNHDIAQARARFTERR